MEHVVGVGQVSMGLTYSDPTRSLRAMTPSPTNSHEVLLGGTGQMMLMNNSRGEIVRRFESPSTVVHLGTLQRSIVCASGSGQVSILDPRTGFRQDARISPVQAHTGGMSGADAQGNIVATWGWTHMQGHPVPDTLVRLYDTRTLRALPPISFSAGPAFVLLNPTDPSKLVIAGQQGMIQVADTSTGTNEFQQLDVNSFITSMTQSPRGDYLVFGDGDGQLHLWTTHDTVDGQLDDHGNLVLPPFNGYEGVKPEWPDHVAPPPPIAWDDNTPLNVIGMPMYEDPLLSNFAPADYATVYSPFFNPPEPIPNAVLSSLNYQDFVGYGSLPKDLRGKRNVAHCRPGAGKHALRHGAIGSRRDSEPRFRSEKDRAKQAGRSQQPEIEEETPAGEVPKYYRKVEIKYSRFGIEDFDFAYYNRTRFSGLETDIINSYTNALLQALHYTEPVRAIAKAHICIDCQKENCLLCEAGFLFRMLEDAKGTNCQATNFSRAFSATPQASALGLMDWNSDKTSTIPPPSTLIQNFNRWLLSTFTTEAVVEGQTFSVRPSTIESMSLKSPPSAINQVLGVAVKTTNRCLSCQHVTVRDSTIQAVDLSWPRKSSAEAPSFADTLKSAIIRSSTTKANCSNCKTFAGLDSRRDLAGDPSTALPPVLFVNAMVSSPEQFEIWKDRHEGGKRKHYLPRRITFRPGTNGEVVVDESGEGIVYEVKSVVVQVQTSPENPAHLLSFCKSEPKFEERLTTVAPQEDEELAKWIMFNDFLVRPVKEEEVFSFPDTWKVPSVIILERVEPGLVDYSRLPKELDTEVLFKDHSMSWHRRASSIEHQLLTPDELPKPGTLISIDAEFVSLQQEELEFRSDGTKKILKPTLMSLARVSVLRGPEPPHLEAVPFIDDYIRTTETVADYLTEFSGIKAGDLDPNSSIHTLVPLKVAYKKLRLCESK